MTIGIGFSAERLLFPEARSIVRSWGLSSRKAYHEYISKKNPGGIPYSPEIVYKNTGWKGWKDYLGVVLTNIGDNLAYRHRLHFCCQEVYQHRNRNKV